MIGSTTKFYVYVPKLQENLLSVSKFLSNEWKVQFNLNERIVKSGDGEVNAIGLHKGNLYEIQLSKVHRVDVANLAQSLVKGHARELGHRWLEHLNVKCMYAPSKLCE